MKYYSTKKDNIIKHILLTIFILSISSCKDNPKTTAVSKDCKAVEAYHSAWQKYFTCLKEKGAKLLTFFSVDSSEEAKNEQITEICQADFMKDVQDVPVKIAYKGERYNSECFRTTFFPEDHTLESKEDITAKDLHNAYLDCLNLKLADIHTEFKCKTSYNKLEF